MKLKAAYSIASTESLAEFLAETYGLSRPVQCSLLQRGFNDNFDVKDADGQRYIFRVSCRRVRGDADVASETAFLRYLDNAGVPVTTTVEGLHGALFSQADMPEGPRAAVLFRYIEGRPVNWADPADANIQGITLARIHNASDEYADRDRCRYRLDLDHLLHRPVKSIAGVKGLSVDARTKLAGFSARLSSAVSAIDNLTWTRCHGDCHGVNARIPDAGRHAGQAVFFDFDDGGPGYLAYDLAVNLWARTFFNRKMHAQWHAFIEGYSSVRPISGTDFEAVHLFAAIRHIWLLGEYSGRISDWGSSSVYAVWIENEIKNLESWEIDKLGPTLL
jgi:Ser/Thr protein kinase RdoA (MazF antagonist)